MELKELQILMFIVLVPVAILIYWWADKKQSHQKLTRFQGRAEMRESEFYSTFYSGSGVSIETVSRVLKDIEDATEIPSSQLRPTDRFDTELAPVKGWEFGDGLSLLAWLTDRSLKKNEVDFDRTKIQTIDDFIRQVGELTKPTDR